MSALELMPHQQLAREKAKQTGSLGIFYDTGTGKTATTIAILRDLCNAEKRIVPTMVFCPPAVISNWKAEFLKFSKIPPEKIIPLTGSGKRRLATLRQALSRYKGNCIAITNYEGVQMADLMAELLLWKPRVLICDESQRLKNHTAVRTKKVSILSDHAEHKYLLTGTPVLQNPMDLFAQFRVLDGGQTFGKNFFAFRARYFYDKNAGMPSQRHFPDWRIRPGAEAEIGRLVGRLTVQAKKSECLSLPPFVRQSIEVELGAAQKKAYNEMLKTFVTFVKENAVVAELAITRTIRLQQILSGFARDEESVDHSFDDNPRLDALRDLLEDIAPSQKIIVWTNFRETYRHIAGLCTKLGIPHVFLTGEQNQREKDAAVADFESDPNIRVIVANPAAGGVGVNLVAASVAIYYSRSYSLEHDIQSEARCYRGGSERHASVTRIDLVAPGTLDETILQALRNKQSVADAVLNFARTQ